MSSIENVPIVDGVTAYLHPESGETFILALNNALYLGDKLQHLLLCPNQARYNNIVVDNVPLHLSQNGTHSIYCPNEELRIPLMLRGCMSYVPCHYPTDEEIHNFTWINITSNGIWDPYSDQFELEEYRCLQLRLGRDVSLVESNPILRKGGNNITKQVLEVYATKSSSRASDIKPERLAELWGISKEKASNTIEATTQMGLRSGIYPLVRRFRTNRHTSGTIYSEGDMELFTPTPSFHRLYLKGSSHAAKYFATLLASLTLFPCWQKGMHT